MESGRGIFPTTGGQGLALKAYNQRKKNAKLRSDRDKMNAFADLLADGYEPQAAAIMLGWVPEFGDTNAAADMQEAREPGAVRVETEPGVFRDRATDLGLPHSHYRCILMDPPWSFKTFGGNGTPHRCAEDHYSTMDFEALKALRVADVAAPDCALFMWVVGSHLEESIELARTWGFSFKTDVFYWLKERLIGAGQIDLFTGDVPAPAISMGYWSRKQLEPCWLFTRGRPPRLNKGVRQLIIEPRREHSRKPDAQYERIEALVDGPRLEMFARSQRPGWDVWGNQTDKFQAVA